MLGIQGVQGVHGEQGIQGIQGVQEIQGRQGIRYLMNHVSEFLCGWSLSQLCHHLSQLLTVYCPIVILKNRLIYCFYNLT